MPIPAPAILDERPPRGAAPKTTVTSMRSRGVVSQPEGRVRSKVLDRPFLMEHDVLKVHNVDDVDWEFRWDRRRYFIKHGEVGYVPFPALVIKMGNRPWRFGRRSCDQVLERGRPARHHPDPL